MESTQDSVKRGSGLATALLAFAVFLALLIGAYMAWRNRPAPEVHIGDAGTASRIEQFAMMTESREVSRTPDFRRAEIAAVMGHGVLDLRQADIKGREAVIEAFVLMGHATIRVPESWTVVTKDMVVMGGTRNHTRREGTDPEKRLRVEGMVLMGALTISH